MNILTFRSYWVSAFAVLFIGLALTTVFGDNAPKDTVKPPSPAYLQTATYLKMAKCRMCHRAIGPRWDLTKHAALNKELPWGKDCPADKMPAAETIYRNTTGYNSTTKSWSDDGVTCEACHGPGSEHFKATKDQRKLTIQNPVNFDTPEQKISLCGRCHGQYTIGDKHYAANFLPGQNLLNSDGFKLDPIEPGKKMQEMNELLASKHFSKGVVCTTCHTSHAATFQEHSLKKPVVELCTGCHKDKTMADHQPNAPADTTCSTCHMPGGVHTFEKPGMK